MKLPQKLIYPVPPLLLSLCLVLNSGCMTAYIQSVGGDANRKQTRVLISEYNMAWESAVDALKTSPMEVVNRESGTLQTKWVDNTAERNLIESMGSISPYIKARYRFQISLAKGYYEGKNSVRISVQKEQQIERDVLTGWVNQESDGIQENSLLYRIAKVIEFTEKLQKIEDDRLKAQLKEATEEVKPNP